MSNLPNPLEHRSADHPIESIFLKRWSPRAMSGDAVSQTELNSLLEAARWAPSTYNEQEWRFLYAHCDTAHWQTFFDLLVEANQAWCENAGVLLVVVSRKFFERNGKPNSVHSFDTGAAFENFCLQGASLGLVVHGMGGFNRSKAQTELKIPEEFNVEAMIAVGKPGMIEVLPEKYQDMESPTGRKPIAETSCEGPFSF